MKRILLLGTIAVLVTISFWFVANSRAASETPRYEVLRTEGDFELREYPEMSIVSASMTDAENNGAFGLLFRYISGANAGQAKIAMTTPVLIERSETGGKMSFVMPRETVAGGVPQPTGEAVKAGKVEPARYAVLRFPGSGKKEEEQAAIARLKTWMEKEGLNGLGTPLVAYYDPPWTPPAIRRNEILQRFETAP